jgi:hypothetical protein
LTASGLLNAWLRLIIYTEMTETIADRLPVRHRCPFAEFHLVQILIVFDRDLFRRRMSRRLEHLNSTPDRVTIG